MIVSYCRGCQAVLEPDASFCSQCGRPVAGEERPLGVVPQVVEVKGFLGMGTRFMNLVVTGRSVILAQQSDTLEERMDAFDELPRTERFVRPDAPWAVYLGMDREQILREDPRNSEILFTALRSVRLTLDDDPDAPSDTLHLVTDEGTLELDLPWGNGRQAQKLLEPLVRVELG